MDVWGACLWGLVGIGLVEAYLMWGAVGSSAGPRWPWVDEEGHRKVGFYVVALVCRCVMGVGLDAVYAATHQVSGALGAVTLGIAAPLVTKQMAERNDAAPPALPDPVPPASLSGQKAEQKQTPEAADVR
ncbi:hypothetical protein ACFV84_13765 [Kitasatospora sp. NPDC059811]|uniref:hypothetical protein n=1 Tax=Streptomycetaceae TaxID=2062 RepID=UPI0007AFB363|nr:hypothetical protein [Streptomyces sp. MJM8645]